MAPSAPASASLLVLAAEEEEEKVVGETGIMWRGRGEMLYVIGINAIWIQVSGEAAAAT